MRRRGKNEEKDAPTTRPVLGSTVMTGLVLLCWPSFVMSTTIRGAVEDAGKVYRCSAVRRVEVSSTRMSVDCG